MKKISFIVIAAFVLCLTSATVFASSMGLTDISDPNFPYATPTPDLNSMVDLSGILGLPREQGLAIVGWSVSPIDDALGVFAYGLNGGSSPTGNQININRATMTVQSVSFTATANKRYRVGNIYIGMPISTARTILLTQGWTQEHLNDAMSLEETHRDMRSKGEAADIPYVTKPSPGNDLFHMGNITIHLEYSYPYELVSRVWYGDESKEPW